MDPFAVRAGRLLRRTRGYPPSRLLQTAAHYALAFASAPVYLRACDRVGLLVRTEGPVRVENRGRIEIGDRVAFVTQFVPAQLRAEPGGEIVIHRDALVSFAVSFRAARRIEIGPGAHVAWWSILHDLLPGEPASAARPIVIGAGAWIAGRVRVMPGCTVGEGAVIGAGSVVAADVPPGVLAVGNPARVVRPILDADEGVRATSESPPRAPGSLIGHLAASSVRAAGRAASALRAARGVSVLGELGTALALAGCDRVGDGVRVEGLPWIENQGRMTIGDGVHLVSRPERTHLVTAPGSQLIVGSRVSIGPGSGICAYARVEIGDDSSLGARCMVLDTSFHGLSDRHARPEPRPVAIGRGVHLGDAAIVLPGTTIGDGAVVEPGSVVSRDVPAGARTRGAHGTSEPHFH